MTITSPTATRTSSPGATLSAFTPAQAQRTFRAVLEAMARPGCVHRIPDVDAMGGRSAAAAVLLALADLMSPVAPLDDADTDLTREVARITGAPLVPVRQARMVLSTVPPSVDRILGLPAGSAWTPESGALLAQEVAGLGDEADEPSVRLTLRGPGIDGAGDLRVTGIGPEALAARDTLCGDFPAGIDLLFVAPDGAVVALPRTTRIEVV